MSRSFVEQTLSNMERHLRLCPLLNGNNNENIIINQDDDQSVVAGSIIDHVVSINTQNHQDENSFIDYNQDLGIAICKIHQTALSIKYSQDEDGVITSINYGYYHLKLYHYQEKDNQTRLCDYLIEKYNQNSTLFIENIDKARASRLELISKNLK